MRIVIGYPPVRTERGMARLAQNRQFFWSKVPSSVYPVVPACAATLLKQAGHEVAWLDGIAQNWTLEKWEEELQKFSPEILMIETKAPVIKHHWEIINKLNPPNGRIKLKIVLVGDHVTALPKESLENCRVDYILTGGNYDFLLLNLVNHLTKKEKLEPGIWSRTAKGFRSTGQFSLNQNLNLMPFINRDLTKWQLYGYNNGNFKYLPGTYIMAGRDCWWRREGGCSFCSWTILYPKFATRTVDNVLDEIGILIEKSGVREIFDDTGTFPVGSWLKEFCEKLIARGYHKKVVMGCNMRFGVLKKEDYKLLAKTNFRFILYGVESANQKTVDRLTKGITIDKIEEELKILKAANKEAGGQLEPHITCMIGYPWESKADAQKTVNLTKDFFKKDLISTLQATIVIPYPGTKLYKECEKNDWLLTKDWNKYDMSEPVMKTSVPAKDLKSLVSSIYSSRLTPGFVIKKLISVRTVDDLNFYFRGGLAALGHAFDFK